MNCASFYTTAFYRFHGDITACKIAMRVLENHDALS